MQARNMLFNVDGLGIAWYTSSSSDFERGNTVLKHLNYTSAPIVLTIYPGRKLRWHAEGRPETSHVQDCAASDQRHEFPLHLRQHRDPCGVRTCTYITLPHFEPNLPRLCLTSALQIRAASSTAITPVNNHPFVFGRHCKHNIALRCPCHASTHLTLTFSQPSCTTA